MSKSKAGGGIKSNKLVHPNVRTGAARREINPRSVAQVGTSRGNHITERAGTVTGDVEKFVGSAKPISAPLGNAVAEATKAGPGGSREVMRSGGQGKY